MKCFSDIVQGKLIAVIAHRKGSVITIAPPSQYAATHFPKLDMSDTLIGYWNRIVFALESCFPAVPKPLPISGLFIYFFDRKNGFVLSAFLFRNFSAHISFAS